MCQWTQKGRVFSLNHTGAGRSDTHCELLKVATHQRGALSAPGFVPLQCVRRRPTSSRLFAAGRRRRAFEEVSGFPAQQVLVARNPGLIRRRAHKGQVCPHIGVTGAAQFSAENRVRTLSADLCPGSVPDARECIYFHIE